MGQRTVSARRPSPGQPTRAGRDSTGWGSSWRAAAASRCTGSRWASGSRRPWCWLTTRSGTRAAMRSADPTAWPGRRPRCPARPVPAIRGESDQGQRGGFRHGHWAGLSATSSFGPQSVEDKADEQGRRPRDEAAQDGRAGPTARVAAHQGVDDAEQTTAGQGRVGQVEGRVGAVALAQPQEGQRNQRQTERDVHPEEPLSGEMLGECVADERAGGRWRTTVDGRSCRQGRHRTEPRR